MTGFSPPGTLPPLLRHSSAGGPDCAGPWTEGRDLLRWLLQAGLCFTAACPGPGTPAGQIYWEEGRRHVGVSVLRLLQEADPSHLPRLFLTQEEDDARN